MQSRRMVVVAEAVECNLPLGQQLAVDRMVELPAGELLAVEDMVAAFESTFDQVMRFGL